MIRAEIDGVTFECETPDEAMLLILAARNLSDPTLTNSLLSLQRSDTRKHQTLQELRGARSHNQETGVVLSPPVPGNADTIGKNPAGVEKILVSGDVAAKMLTVCRRTLWTLTNDNEIPSVNIGRLVRYDPNDLRAWVAKNKTGGPLPVVPNDKPTKAKQKRSKAKPTEEDPREHD